MPSYRFHVFVCTNRRPPGDRRGSCAERGGEAVVAALKREVEARGLVPSDAIRINKSGCLNECERGPTVVVYPEGVWYAGVRPEDVPDLVSEHLIGGQPLARLRHP
jgi:(2Fe-2S) ferredoxin